MRTNESHYKASLRSLQAEFSQRETEYQRRLELAESAKANAENQLRNYLSSDRPMTPVYLNRGREVMDEYLDSELENLDLESDNEKNKEKNLSTSLSPTLEDKNEEEKDPSLISSPPSDKIQERENEKETSTQHISRKSKRTEILRTKTSTTAPLPDLALSGSEDEEDIDNGNTIMSPSQNPKQFEQECSQSQYTTPQSENRTTTTMTSEAAPSASVSSEEITTPGQGRAWLPCYRKVRTDEHSMQALAQAIGCEEKNPKLMRSECLAHVRRALNEQKDIDALVESLALVPYGTVVRFPPFNKRPNRRSHRIEPHPKRSRTEAKDASECWNSGHVIVEILAWWGCHAIDETTPKCAEIFIRLASPARLGASTLTEALRATLKGSISLEVWRLALPEERVKQLNEALIFWGIRDPEQWPSAAFQLEIELRSRLGLPCTVLQNYIHERTQVRHLLSNSSGLAKARATLFSAIHYSCTTSTSAVDINYRAIAEAGWILICADPLDTLVGEARAFLMNHLDSSWEAASALAACLNGLENDGSTTALLNWAHTTFSSDKELPPALMRKLAALQRRPLARFLNLAQATDRQRAMARLALVTNLALERIEAFDGNIVTIPSSRVSFYWSEAARSLNAKFDTSSRGTQVATSVPMSPSERGCAASHIELWGKAARDHKPVLILEDDIVLAPQFNQRYAAALAALPDDVDILLLGYWAPGTEHCLENRSLSTLRRFLFLDYFWGLHAYVLTPRGARILLDNLPVDAPADVYVAKLVNKHQLVAAAVKHKLVKQRTQSTSSIVHTNRQDAGVVYDKRKTAATALIYDHADTLSNRLW